MKPARAKRPRRPPVSGKRKGAVRKTATVLSIVQSGVIRFILNDAPIGGLRRAIRIAAREGERSSHPLTREVFRRIVRRAIQERERRIRRILHSSIPERPKKGVRNNDR